MGVGIPPPGGLGSWFVGGAIKTMLSAISAAVDGAAAEALRLTGSMLSATTNPGLLSTWFSATYWRVAALSALLTVPFLCAAAAHALVRSDLALLGRAAFGYLPLAAIGVTIAAPLTTLLLSATDEMCAIVAGAAGHDNGSTLLRAAAAVAQLSTSTASPMLGFFIGLLAVGATIGLWIELLIRAAAVDVIVLLLPLFFAAMVWPARRVWAVRAIETLVALILSKFAIVAVLALGGTAFGGGSSGLNSSLVGATLIVLSVLSPWALLRLLPLHEVAAAAAGGLSQHPRDAARGAARRLYETVHGAGAESSGAGGDEGLGPEDDGVDALALAGGFADVGATARAARAAGAARGAGPALGDGAPADDQAGANEAAGPDDYAGADAPGDAVDSVDAGSLVAADAPVGAGSLVAADAPVDAGLVDADDLEFDAETAAGLAAIEGAGRHATPAAGTTALAPRPEDDRPPIDSMFGAVEWQGFVIGEEGDDVMQAPRFTVRGRDADDDGGVS